MFRRKKAAQERPASSVQAESRGALIEEKNQTHSAAACVSRSPTLGKQASFDQTRQPGGARLFAMRRRQPGVRRGDGKQSSILE
jgi:hypothetical protein